MDDTTVKTIQISFDVAIRKFEWEHGYVYDWCTEYGDESDTTFDTVAEAEQDARDQLGG